MLGGVTTPTEGLQIGQQNVKNGAVLQMMNLRRLSATTFLASRALSEFSGPELYPVVAPEINAPIPVSQRHRAASDAQTFRGLICSGARRAFDFNRGGEK